MLIYNSQDIFAVEKPPLLHTLDSNKLVEVDQLNRQDQDSLEKKIKLIFPDNKFINTPGNQGGLINRLDFETSGIVLGCFSQEAKDSLKLLFQTKKIVKNYFCLVEGEIKNNSTLKNFIGGRYRNSKKLRFSIKKSREL